MTNSSPIKAGDLLYAVGPGHHAPHSATDLQVYSAIVEAVCPERSSPSPCARIELGDDRPILGFPRWIYRDYDVGVKVHRSRSDALHAFAEDARRRRDIAESQRKRADEEVQWALATTATTAEGTENEP